jgi:hypothetical protein
MKNDDDFDMPEVTEEILNEFRQPPPTDLHLGPATVKPFNRSWAKQHGPKPLGISIHALDLLIAAMASVVVWEIITVWWWIIAT